MRQKVACFFMLVFLVTLFLLSGEIGMTEASELEAKRAKIEAGLKQMESELDQMEKGLIEMKEDLEKIQKKMVSNEEATKKQIPDNKKSSNLFLLMIAIIIALVGIIFFR